MYDCTVNIEKDIIIIRFESDKARKVRIEKQLPEDLIRLHVSQFDEIFDLFKAWGLVVFYE